MAPVFAHISPDLTDLLSEVDMLLGPESLRRAMDASSVRFITECHSCGRVCRCLVNHLHLDARGHVMGLFDIIKDKAAELLSGASDKVNDLTGAELPGTEAADQLEQSADNLADTAATAGQNLTDTAQDVTGSVSDVATDAITDPTDPSR